MTVRVSLSLSGSSSAHCRPQVHLLPPFLFSYLSHLSKRNSLPESWSPPLLEIFLPWRRRLRERRPSPLAATSAPSRYAAPAPSLTLCCARRSTPNPNKTICIRIWIQLQYIELPTNLDFVCKNKNYRVYMCTPMSYAGSAPDLSSHFLRY